MNLNIRRNVFVRYGFKFFFVSLVLAVFLCVSCYVNVETQGEYLERDFTWNYGGRQWTWSLSISKWLYNQYKSVPVSIRTQYGVAGYGFLTTTGDEYLILVADKLQEAASTKGYDKFETVSFVLAFVQGLPYTADSETSGYDEYPRFPLETLVDRGGDCEDTSILFATLTLIMNYDTVYINPPDHVAVGIWGTDLPGSYYTFNDRTYYYCETTGEGFTIGESPAAYRTQKAYIYEIQDSEQYDPYTGTAYPDLLTTRDTPYAFSVNSISLLIALLAVLLFVYIVHRFTSAPKEKAYDFTAVSVDRTEVKRPLGLTLIAILWFVGGLYNAYTSFQIVSNDLQVLPYLANPIYAIHQWFKFAIPIELVLSVCLFCVALVQIIIVPGFWIGKPYAYKLALIVPVFLVIVNLSTTMLYASAPADIDVGSNLSYNVFLVIMGMVWVIVYWTYLHSTPVKMFLNVGDSRTLSRVDYSISSDERSQRVTTDFYCRYCGAENKSDATFCEKCGNKIH